MYGRDPVGSSREVTSGALEEDSQRFRDNHGRRQRQSQTYAPSSPSRVGRAAEAQRLCARARANERVVQTKDDDKATTITTNKTCAQRHGNECQRLSGRDTSFACPASCGRHPKRRLHRLCRPGRRDWERKRYLRGVERILCRARLVATNTNRRKRSVTALGGGSLTKPSARWSGYDGLGHGANGPARSSIASSSLSYTAKPARGRRASRRLTGRFEAHREYTGTTCKHRQACGWTAVRGAEER